MELTEYTIPDLIAKIKEMGSLNNIILNAINGGVEISGSLREVLRGIYEGDILLNKDTIGVYLRTDASYSKDSLGIPYRDVKDEVLFAYMLEKMHIIDVIKTIDELYK